ncbi:MAG: hypothetical protein AAB426_07600, partial [Myxococcota bacterium]
MTRSPTGSRAAGTLDDVEIKNGYTPTIGICYHRVRAELFKLLVGDRRFVESMTLDGGFEAIKSPTMADLLDG